MAWNWKAAAVSAVSRASIFFVANLASGFEAAVAAMQLEFVYRIVAAGFYGAMTQAFSRVKPERFATLAALIVVPGVAHTVEFFLHRWAGTPQLFWSILGSVAFSLVTTKFNLFLMRRGVMTVGQGSASWRADLRAIRRLIGGASW